jgi:hypothetical protein
VFTELSLLVSAGDQYFDVFVDDVSCTNAKAPIFLDFSTNPAGTPVAVLIQIIYR